MGIYCSAMCASLTSIMTNGCSWAGSTPPASDQRVGKPASLLFRWATHLASELIAHAGQARVLLDSRAQLGICHSELELWLLAGLHLRRQAWTSLLIPVCECLVVVNTMSVAASSKECSRCISSGV